MAHLTNGLDYTQTNPVEKKVLMVSLRNNAAETWTRKEEKVKSLPKETK